MLMEVVRLVEQELLTGLLEWLTQDWHKDKQRLGLDRGSQGDLMDDSRSPTGVLRTNAFSQISLKILHANPPLAKL